MADQRSGGIAWTQKTWNPVRGCSRVSEGCRNCYAETFAARFNGPGQPYEGLVERTSKGPRWTGQVRVVEEHLYDPLKWRKSAMVFVNSMSDLFHENFDGEVIDWIFAVMASSSQHTFQVLTKRPKRMAAYMSDDDTPGRVQACIEEELSGALFKATIPPIPWPLPNIWLGVSVENQATAEERIQWLLDTPAAVRWISAEPLLGPLDLRDLGVPPMTWARDFRRGLDWVVVGGESGHEARPMHPDWARQIRDQCQAAGVPFFFKQWGEFAPRCAAINSPSDWDGTRLQRVGKKTAGALLDGHEWRQFPSPRDFKETTR